MIEDFLKKEDISIKVDLEESLKRKAKTGESRVAVVKVQGETTINNLAEEIIKLQEYGCACIVTFDEFQIDTRDYDSSEKIVNAYNRELELREKSKSREVMSWMNRFKNWCKGADRKTRENSDIIKTIRERLGRKEEREQK